MTSSERLSDFQGVPRPGPTRKNFTVVIKITCAEYPPLLSHFSQTPRSSPPRTPELPKEIKRSTPEIPDKKPTLSSVVVVVPPKKEKSPIKQEGHRIATIENGLVNSNEAKPIKTLDECKREAEAERQQHLQQFGFQQHQYSGGPPPQYGHNIPPHSNHKPLYEPSWYENNDQCFYRYEQFQPGTRGGYPSQHNAYSNNVYPPMQPQQPQQHHPPMHGRYPRPAPPLPPLPPPTQSNVVTVPLVDLEPKPKSKQLPSSIQYNNLLEIVPKQLPPTTEAMQVNPSQAELDEAKAAEKKKIRNGLLESKEKKRLERKMRKEKLKSEIKRLVSMGVLDVDPSSDEDEGPFDDITRQGLYGTKDQGILRTTGTK